MTTAEASMEGVRARALDTLDRLIERVQAAGAREPVPDDAELEARYAAGCAALAGQRMTEAADLFGQIAQARPAEPRYLFAFGLCLQHFGHIGKALEFFGAAYALDASDAAAAYRLGECFHALGYDEEAREALQMAVNLCDLPDNDPDIRALAHRLLDSLTQAGR